jgi:hypothetical protein
MDPGLRRDDGVVLRNDGFAVVVPDTVATAETSLSGQSFPMLLFAKPRYDGNAR